MNGYVNVSGDVGQLFACQRCGALVPDAGSIQTAHNDWHESLDEMTAVFRLVARSTLIPSISNPPLTGEEYGRIMKFVKGGS